MVQHRPVHLRKLDNGTWQVSVYKSGHRASATARTKSEATSKGVELLLELGGRPKARGMTVQELTATWLTSADLSATYRVDAGRVLNAMPDTFADRKIADITPSVIEGFYRQLGRDGWSVNRVRRLHAVLSSAWTMARRYEWATVNPFTAAKRPAEPKREIEPPSVDQVIKFLEAVDGPFGLFIELAAATGARRGEVCALQWADIKDDAIVMRRSISQVPGELVVTDGKTGAKGHRVVAISDVLAQTLAAHRRRQVELALSAGLPSPVWLFSHDAGVTPWRPDYVSREFRRLRDRLQLPSSIRLHDLRHFVATQLLAAGIPLKTVSERLGHRQLSTTSDRYGHWVPAADRAASDVMAGLRRAK